MHPTTPCPPADNLLDQLRAEESLLGETLVSLTELTDALRRGDLATVNAARPRQESLATALADRARCRTAAATSLAEAVGLPATTNLTLAVLAAHLPDPTAKGLLASRDRLANLVAKISEYQRRNANLIRHLRSYFRGVMAVLAAADAPIRYGPSGANLAPRAGAMIQVRG